MIFWQCCSPQGQALASRILEAKFCVLGLGLEGPVLGLGLALSVQALALVSGVITNYTLEVEKSQSTNIVIHSVLTGQLTNQISSE